MKPTKEQIKIVLNKICIWQSEQRAKENYNVAENVIIDNGEASRSESLQIEIKTNEKTIQDRYNLIPRSEKAKMMFQIKKNKEIDKKDKIPKFDNEQMLLHLYDVYKKVELKFEQELISTQEDFKIIYNNQIVSIEPCLVEGAFAYKELNKKFKLEAKTLIEEIIIRMGNDYSHVTETFLIDFFKEIRKQKKIQNKKEEFKRKIIWIKK